MIGGGGGGRTRIAWPKATAREEEGAGGGCVPSCAEREAETTSILQSEWEAKNRSIATTIISTCSCSVALSKFSSSGQGGGGGGATPHLNTALDHHLHALILEPGANHTPKVWCSNYKLPRVSGWSPLMALAGQGGHAGRLYGHGHTTFYGELKLVNIKKCMGIAVTACYSPDVTLVKINR